MTLGTPALLYSPATGATGFSDYRFITASSSYRFNWDTTVRPAGGPGCYTVVWQFDDAPDSTPEPRFVRMKTIELK
jgi:hypothetical protein